MVLVNLVRSELLKKKNVDVMCRTFNLLIFSTIWAGKKKLEIYWNARLSFLILTQLQLASFNFFFHFSFVHEMY